MLFIFFVLVFFSLKTGRPIYPKMWRLLNFCAAFKVKPKSSLYFKIDLFLSPPMILICNLLKEIRMEKEKPQLSESQKVELQSELGLTEEEFKSLKKKLRNLKVRDDKTFMDMLRTVNKNHYTLNQMVDRKARILLSVNALILSWIIGKIITNHEMHDWKFYLLLFLGASSLISIIYSMMAVKPEKSHGHRLNFNFF